ncbi:MAG TPA: Ig-like domain repeat protein [Acidobacteriaceae bacterium]|nr:Ig-like domain repeat protein [Acidobacteriaceae bacterium]
MVVLFAAARSLAQAITPFSGTTAVGQHSSPLTVNVNITVSGEAATLIAVTQGIPNADFTQSGGSCSSGSYNSGDHCTATVVFAPQRPGRRWGAVLVENSGGTLLGSALLTGLATGGLPALAPGRIDTVAGDTEWVYQRDGVLATQAPIFLPMGLAVDAAGNVFLADSSNNRIRRVDAVSGDISTVAGTGTPGYSGDGGPATSAAISNPAGLLLDGAGDLYFADTGNAVIRRIDAVSGDISTVAGTPGVSGYSGDGGAATSAHLSVPEGIAFDAAGDLLIADTGNHVVREVNAVSGTISTVAGTGTAGYNGDGEAATSAKLDAPWSVAVADDGSILIADTTNNRVRSIGTSGIISTVAGSGSAGFTGDGDLATSAELDAPTSVVVDPAGDLYIADSGNNRVREVNATSKVLATIIGTDSEQFAGDAGPSTSASLYGPYSLFFDGDGNLFVADMFHNRVRRISASAISLEYPTMRVSKLSAPQSQNVVNDGNVTLNLSAPVLNNAALDSGTTTCGSTLEAAESCILGVEFAPTITGDPVLGSVTVASDAASPAPVISLSGEVLSVYPTSVALVSSANPSLVGENVTFTATVTSDDTSRSGTVVFDDGATQLCSVTLSSSGTATCSTTTLTLGSHNITASYSGDANNASSVSPVFTQIVKQSAALTLVVSPNPSVVTATVTLTLTATAPTGTPTGTITFYDGATPIGTATLNSSGTASITTATLAPGTHALSAQYPGDNTNASGESNTISEVIQQAATTTTLSTTNATPTVGTSVTFTATISSAEGPLPSGSVTFTDGGTTLGTEALDGSGTATLTLSSLAPGTHSIVASYGGDTDDAVSSSSPLTETVAQIATVTTLSSDANPLSAGGTLHLTATVALAPGAAADGGLTGSVTFTDGITTLGTVAVDGSGHATFDVSTLTVGSHTMVASYGGATNYATSSSTALTQVVQKTATTVTVTPSATTVLTGKSVTFAVTVTSATGIPTGTVTLHDGSVVLGQTTLNAQGVASFSLSNLTTGTHSLTVSYDGDANYSTSTSPAWTETVNLAQPTVTLSGPADPVDVGTSVTLSGTLSSPGITPAGTLMLRDGSTTIATQSASGSFTFATSSLALGNHSLSVAYSGDSDNAAASSATISVVIQQAPTATALGLSANPATFGQPVTLTASVVSDSPSLTGTVTFFDGSASLGSAMLLTNGTATLTTSVLSFGTHSLTASYSGDGQHEASTSVAVSERVVEPATATLVSSLNPAVSGVDVSFTATIVASGNETPTGTVLFRDGGTTLGTAAVDGAGAAVLHDSTLAVGSHIITVSYAGDANVAAASASLTETIQSATTQVTLAASANPATYAAQLTLTATVASNGGAATGSVTFTDDGASIGSAVLNGQGIATLTLSTLSPGTHNIVANYAGDGRASASVSTPLAVLVKQTTSLALASSPNPALTLAAITLTATLTNSGAAAATGSVIFSEGAAQLGTATLDGSGHASLTLPSLSAGTHNILASYAGDGSDFASISAALSQAVNLRATTTTLTGSQTDASNPQQVTLIAVVHSDGAATPSGSVSFSSGSLSIGSAPVDATGVATLTILVEATEGSENIVASYSGDAVYAASSSTATSVQAGPATQFTLTIDPAAVSVVTKQHTTIDLALTSIKGFSDTIQMGCLGLPFAATCTFSAPQTKLAANGTATVQLTVDTGDPLGVGSANSAMLRRGSSGALLCLLPGALLLGFASRRRARRKFIGLLLILCAAALTLTAVGCAGLQGSGTPPGTYTFKVTASGQGSGATQSQVVTLTVTQ